MDKRQKTMLVSILIVLLLIVLITGYTFAKYNTRFYGNATMKIARWQFGVDGITVDDNGVHELSLLDISTIESRQHSTMIAPGYQGKVTLYLHSNNTDVPINYSIYATEENEKPQHLTYKALVNDLIEYTDDTLSGLVEKLSGKLDVNETKKIDIYAIWPYELDSEDPAEVALYDAQDIEDGKALEDGSNRLYTFSLEVVGEQDIP